MFFSFTIPFYCRTLKYRWQKITILQNTGSNLLNYFVISLLDIKVVAIWVLNYMYITISFANTTTCHPNPTLQHGILGIHSDKPSAMHWTLWDIHILYIHELQNMFYILWIKEMKKTVCVAGTSWPYTSHGRRPWVFWYTMISCTYQWLITKHLHSLIYLFSCKLCCFDVSHSSINLFIYKKLRLQLICILESIKTRKAWCNFCIID